MTADTVQCAQCSGRGYQIAYACPGFRRIKIPCDSCAGTGAVTIGTAPELASLREQGEKLHSERIERHESLRDAAARLGVDVVRYSHIELGLEALP